MTARIVVIGAGICGVSTAIWLQRSGHEVILLDKGDPGMGASYGNAGAGTLVYQRVLRRVVCSPS